jgi:hypothetical protein
MAVAAAVALAKLARCIPSHALAVATKLRCLSSLGVISPYIAAVVTRRNHTILDVPVIADRAGNPSSIF